MLMDEGPATMSAAIFPKEQKSPFLSSHRLSIASPQRWGLRGLSPLHARSWLDLTLQVLWRHPQVLCIAVHNSHVQNSAFHNSPPHPSAIAVFLPILPRCSPSLRCSKHNVEDLPVAEHPHLYVAFWSDMIFCMNHFPVWWWWWWWGGGVSLSKVRATQTCGHKHKYLEYSLT